MHHCNAPFQVLPSSSVRPPNGVQHSALSVSATIFSHMQTSGSSWKMSTVSLVCRASSTPTPQSCFVTFWKLTELFRRSVIDSNCPKWRFLDPEQTTDIWKEGRKLVYLRNVTECHEFKQHSWLLDYRIPHTELYERVEQELRKWKDIDIKLVIGRHGRLRLKSKVEIDRIPDSTSMKDIIDVFHRLFYYCWRSYQAKMHNITILRLVIPQICTTLQEVARPPYHNWISIQIPWSWISVCTTCAHGSHISKLQACTVWICWLAGTSATHKWKCAACSESVHWNSDATDQHRFQGTNQVVWQEQVRVSFTASLRTLTEMTAQQNLLWGECDFKIFQASCWA